MSGYIPRVQTLTREQENLTNRLREIHESASLPDLSIEKELRQYPVQVDALLRNLLIDEGISWTGSDRVSTVASQVESVNILRRLLFAGLLQLEGKSDLIFPVKLSSKSFVPGTRKTHAKIVKSLVHTARLKGGFIPSLVDVISAYDANYDLSCLVGELFEEGNFYSDLRHVLTSSEIPVLVRQDHIEFSNKWHKVPHATLKTRFYLSRCDYRAYYVEEDPIRHLVGAVLLRILAPKPKHLREKSLFSEVYPVMNKDRLDQEFTFRPSQGMRCIFGDISSFTSSAVNFPALALLMLKLADCGKRDPLISTKMIVSIQGELMEVDVLDTLRLYVRLTVWAPVKVGEQTFVASGGYLGLTGNINLTLLAFAFVLLTYQRSLETQGEGISMYLQLGGDDFFVAFAGTSMLLDDCVEDFLKLVKACVGHLKLAPTVDPFNHQGEGNLYCKRRVLISTAIQENLCKVRVYTEENVLIPSQLFETYDATNESKLRQDAQCYFRSIQQAACHGDISVGMEWDLLSIFEEIHGPVSLYTSGSYMYAPRCVCEAEGVRMTLKAQIQVSLIPSAYTRDLQFVRTSVRNKMALALSQDKVCFRTVLFGSATGLLLMTQAETKSYATVKLPYVFRHDPDWNLDEVLHLIHAIRSLKVVLFQ